MSPDLMIPAGLLIRQASPAGGVACLLATLALLCAVLAWRWSLAVAERDRARMRARHYRTSYLRASVQLTQALAELQGRQAAAGTDMAEARRLIAAWSSGIPDPRTSEEDR